MHKALLGCVVAAASTALLAGTARADEGRHLGQLGQDCTASVYGFPSLGAGFHAIVVDTGSARGGAPVALETYC